MSRLVIDSDAHVLETERTWDYLEPVDRKYRPVPVTVPADPSIGRARRDAWVIDGKIRGLRFPILTEEELTALSARLLLGFRVLYSHGRLKHATHL